MANSKINHCVEPYTWSPTWCYAQFPKTDGFATTQKRLRSHCLGCAAPYGIPRTAQRLGNGVNQILLPSKNQKINKTKLRDLDSLLLGIRGLKAEEVFLYVSAALCVQFTLLLY